MTLYRNLTFLCPSSFLCWTSSALIFFIGIFGSHKTNAQQVHRYTVISGQPPLLIADAGEDILSITGETITLGGDPVADGGTPPYTYQWTTDAGFSEDEQHPEITTGTGDTMFALKVQDAKGCTASDDVMVKVEAVDIPTSVAGRKESSFSVYPNPGRNWLIIKTEIIGNETLSLADQQGKILLREPVTPLEHRLDIRFLPDGMYTITLDNGKEQNTMRVVISR